MFSCEFLTLCLELVVFSFFQFQEWAEQLIVRRGFGRWSARRDFSFFCSRQDIFFVLFLFLFLNVFESCLDELLSVCPLCAAECSTVDETITGTCLSVSRTCRNGRVSTHTKWRAGNILVAAAMLFTGSSSKKVPRLLRHNDRFRGWETQVTTVTQSLHEAYKTPRQLS